MSRALYAPTHIRKYQYLHCTLCLMSVHPVHRPGRVVAPTIIRVWVLEGRVIGHILSLSSFPRICRSQHDPCTHPALPGRSGSLEASRHFCRTIQGRPRSDTNYVRPQAIRFVLPSCISWLLQLLCTFGAAILVHLSWRESSTLS